MAGLDSQHGLLTFQFAPIQAGSVGSADMESDGWKLVVFDFQVKVFRAGRADRATPTAGRIRARNGKPFQAADPFPWSLPVGRVAGIVEVEMDGGADHGLIGSVHYDAPKGLGGREPENVVRGDRIVAEWKPGGIARHESIVHHADIQPAQALRRQRNRTQPTVVRGEPLILLPFVVQDAVEVDACPGETASGGLVEDRDKEVRTGRLWSTSGVRRRGGIRQGASSVFSRSGHRR